EVRLQWWRDAVSGSARGDVLRNPVAAALLTAIEAGSLPGAPFLELIDAHTFDLYDDPMPDQGQLDAYCDSTAGALFRLATMLLAGREMRKLVRLLQHAGRAYAMTGLLRAFALHASRGQLYFPVNVLRRHGVDHNAILMGRESPGLSSALAEFRLLARRHYQWVSRLLPSAPPAARAALLPLEIVPLYLDRMERASYHPFKTRVEVAQWRRQWRLWRAARSLG